MLILTSYEKEVNCTEPYPSGRVPWCSIGTCIKVFTCGLYFKNILTIIVGDHK